VCRGTCCIRPERLPRIDIPRMMPIASLAMPYCANAGAHVPVDVSPWTTAAFSNHSSVALTVGESRHWSATDNSRYLSPRPIAFAMMKRLTDVPVGKVLTGRYSSGIQGSPMPIEPDARRWWRRRAEVVQPLGDPLDAVALGTEPENVRTISASVGSICRSTCERSPFDPVMSTFR
jgi:hypothetical protein